MKSKKEATQKSESSVTTALLFFTLVLFGTVVYIYYNGLTIPIITIGSAVYLLLKKYLPIKPIDNFLNRIFGSKIIVSFICGIFIMISAFIIAQKEFSIFSNDQSFQAQKFNGIVWDEQNEPLNNVIVYLPELNIYDTTDILGRFSFNISDSNFTVITFIAQKEGYKTYEAEGSVGNPNYNFNMIKK